MRHSAAFSLVRQLAEREEVKDLERHWKWLIMSQVKREDTVPTVSQPFVTG